MAITADEIRIKIAAAIPGAEVTVQDLTGGGDHYAATVVAAAFRGQGPVDRHRMVYAALGVGDEWAHPCAGADHAHARRILTTRQHDNANEQETTGSWTTSSAIGLPRRFPATG